jgi:DNA-binding XRE family transcriptional regulator
MNELEQRIADLEKRVAALEGKAQEQPVVKNEDLVKSLHQSFVERNDEMKRQELKIARIRKSLTQKDLATLVGIGSQAISDYESGRINPSYDVMKRIASVLNATVDELFYSEDKEV